MLPIQNEHLLPTSSDSSLGIISSFQLGWQVRPRLALRAGSYGGATWLPPMHGLALGSRFHYTGWKQIAVTATYELGQNRTTEVEFAIGNGEEGNH